MQKVFYKAGKNDWKINNMVSYISRFFGIKNCFDDIDTVGCKHV